MIMSEQENHRLLIMRHAKSDWNTGTERDFDRPLSHRGRRDALKMASWLSGEGLTPGLLVSSPALRTLQTSEIIVRELGLNRDIVIRETQIYEAGLNDLLNVVDRYAGRDDNILLIGHNPGVDSLVSFLAEEEPARTATGKLMTTAALAILHYGPEGITTSEGSARLHRLVRPRELP